VEQIRVYDEQRIPVWTHALAPSQYAVFHVDAETGRHRNAYGQRFASHWERTCLVFDSLEEAERYAEKKVAQVPSLACKIYDRSGDAEGPVATVVSESVNPLTVERSGFRHARWGAALSILGVVCFWYLWWVSWDSVMAALFGSKFLTFGPALLTEGLLKVRKARNASRGKNLRAPGAIRK
jgi:hypothetical protein